MEPKDSVVVYRAYKDGTGLNIPKMNVHVPMGSYLPKKGDTISVDLFEELLDNEDEEVFIEQKKIIIEQIVYVNGSTSDDWELDKSGNMVMVILDIVYQNV